MSWLALAVVVGGASWAVGAGCRDQESSQSRGKAVGGPPGELPDDVKVAHCAVAADPGHRAPLPTAADAIGVGAFAASLRSHADALRMCGATPGSVHAALAIDAAGAVTGTPTAYGIADGKMMACVAHELASVQSSPPPSRPLAIACDLTFRTREPLRVDVADDPVIRASSAHVRLQTGMIATPLPVPLKLAPESFGRPGARLVIEASATARVDIVFALAAAALAAGHPTIDLAIDSTPAPPTFVGRWFVAASLPAPPTPDPKVAIHVELRADKATLSLAGRSEPAPVTVPATAAGLRGPFATLARTMESDGTAQITADKTVWITTLLTVATTARGAGLEPEIVGPIP